MVSLADVVIHVVTKSFSGMSCTVMAISAVSVKESVSVTVSVNVILVFWLTLGAVNVGVAVVESVSVTAGPLVCTQEYDKEFPSSGSLERVPSSVTISPSVTVWGSPASAVGAVLITVMDRSGAAAISLPAVSEMAPASMSSCGVFISLTVVLWGAESVRVMVIDDGSTVLVVTSSSESPPEDWPVSRTAIRS